MRRLFVCLLALSVMLLAACQSSQLPTTTGGAAAMPTTTKQNDPQPTDPKPTEPKPTEPKPTEPKPTDPTPTEPTQPLPSTPEEQLAKINALFGDHDSWYNRALFRLYADPSDIQLMAVFHRGFEEESKEPTDAEWEQLKDQPGFDINENLMRLPVDRMNQVLMDLFGITLEDVDEEGFEGLVYLESTNCYYHMTEDAWITRNFNAFEVQTLEDGTIRVYYTANGDSTVLCVTLMPNGDGYRILSNIVWPASTTQPLPDTPAEVLAEFNALFGDTDSWYNKALTSEYETPAQLSLFNFFIHTFREASNQVSDSEIAQLKDVYGYSDGIDMIPITRLPADRMNQVLQLYFGVTLEDIEEAGFHELDYLESTDCYYIVDGSAVVTMVFNAISVEYMEDGTIRVYYTAEWESTVRCVRLMPHGDGYKILSNVSLS